MTQRNHERTVNIIWRLLLAIHILGDIMFHYCIPIVVPVLLYGCEIWGYENIEVIESVHLKFLKYVFNLKSSTPS